MHFVYNNSYKSLNGNIADHTCFVTLSCSLKHSCIVHWKISITVTGMARAKKNYKTVLRQKKLQIRKYCKTVSLSCVKYESMIMCIHNSGLDLVSKF